MSTIDALHNLIEKEYAAGIAAPYNATFLHGVLALAEVGYRHQQRMVDLGAALLNTLEGPEREAVLEQYRVPATVLRKIGAAVVWPEPASVVDSVISLTPDQEATYRAQLERSINYHAEAEAGRVVTYGIRKQYTYMEKRREAEAFLELAEPEHEVAADWPYLNADVEAGAQPDLLSAAQLIKATADGWHILNAHVETVVQVGIHGIRNSPIEEISGIAAQTNAAVTSAVDTALGVE